MRKSLLMICSLILTLNLFAQVPADSLKGTYAGMHYIKATSTDPWTIIQDTIIVTSIDSIFCQADVIICSNQNMPLFSEYSSCNSPLQGNYYARFHNIDSLTAIADSNTINPSCPNVFSVRFYGKRISSNSSLNINENKKQELLSIFPNPSNGNNININLPFVATADYDILNVLGSVVAKGKILNADKIEMDISNIAKGCYFVKVISHEVGNSKPQNLVGRFVKD